MDDGDKVPELLGALGVVGDAIELADGALHDNPTKEQERALNRALLRLNAELGVLNAELDAALAEDTTVQGPTEAQLAKIAELTDEVENAKNANATISARIALISKVLTVASAILPTKVKPA